MQKIDVQIVESARIDGANEGQVMRYIILPALSGTIVNAAILAISGSLSSFALVFAMTGGGPSRVTEILSIYMYNNAFLGRPNFPLANAISLIMVLISFGLIVLTKAVEKATAERRNEQCPRSRIKSKKILSIIGKAAVYLIMGIFAFMTLYQSSGSS